MAHKKPSITPQQRANYLARNSEDVRVGDDAVRFNFTSSSMGYPDTPLTGAFKNIAHALGVSLDMNGLVQLQEANPSPLTASISGITVSDLSEGKFRVGLVGDAKEAYNNLQKAAAEPTASAARG